MKRVLIGWFLAATMAATAHGADINVFLSAASAVSSPPNSQQQNFNFDQTTGLLSPTTYSVSSANGGGSSTDNTTVSLGTFHSYSDSTFPLNSTTGYSEGYVDIFSDDRGVAPGPLGAAIPPLTVSFSLTGTTSPIPSNGAYSIEAVVYDNLIDLDNGNSSTKIARTFFDLQNPAADVFSAPLAARGGDRIENSVVFEISTYQAGNASQSDAFIDYTETLKLYIDTGVPGQDFVSNSGYDYASLSGTPEPASLELAGIGALLLLWTGFRRASRSKLALRGSI